MGESKLEELLNNSKAEDSFKAAVLAFLDGKDSDLIKYSYGSPRIKILRVLMKLLEEFPDDAITNVDIQGKSSCSSFAGLLTFGPDQTKVQFNWDCSWRAKQEGLITWYGQPDQRKAALTYGYQCFEIFQPVTDI